MKKMTNLDIGLLILRIVVGIIFVGHGSQKLFGWFDGPGMDGTTSMMEKMGMEPPQLWAWLSAMGELFGGLGLALGLLTPIAATALVGSMLVAIIKVHWPNGLWNSDGGYEFPLVMAAAAFSVGLMGPGLLSLDNLLNLPLRQPLAYGIALLLMLAIVAVGLVQSMRQEAEERQHA